MTPLNTGAPAKASSFGLGSGAFASFGSSTKTPKTPGTAFDFSKASLGPSSPGSETEKHVKPSAKAGDAALKNLPLKYGWVMWYRPPTGKNSDYEKSIKPVYKMRTVHDFWRVYTHLKRPSALPTVSDYHFFREGIRPVWEDEENKRGGKWIMRLKKGVMDRYWEEILLATVGDQFAEAGEEVCGLVVSVRSGEDVMSIWTKFDNGRNVKIRYASCLQLAGHSADDRKRETIKRVLSLPADTNIVWKSHDDSIAQRSAIDQARQERGNIDKRRATLTSDGSKEGL